MATSLSRNLLLISHTDINEAVLTLMQAAAEEGAVGLKQAYQDGLVKTSLSIADLHDGPIWVISWKDDYRALVRTRDSQTAWFAGIEFASNGGSPFDVADPYDWSSDIVLNKKKKVVTTKELKVEMLSCELVRSLRLNIELSHNYNPTNYLKSIAKYQDE